MADDVRLNGTSNGQFDASVGWLAAAPLNNGSSPLSTLLGLEPSVAQQGQTANWLRALGNSGAPEALSVANRYVTDASPDVRAAAAAAMRNVADPVAATTLAAMATNDADAMVRVQAIEALGNRNEADGWNAIRSAATTDADASVRLTAVHALGRQSSNAQNRAALAQVAGSETVPEVRSASHSYLQPR